MSIRQSVSRQRLMAGSEAVSALVLSTPADDSGSDEREDGDQDEHDNPDDQKDVAVNRAVLVVTVAVPASVCNKCQTQSDQSSFASSFTSLN